MQKNGDKKLSYGDIGHTIVADTANAKSSIKTIYKEKASTEAGEHARGNA